MVTEKTMRHVNRNWDLEELSKQIVNFLRTDGFITQSSSAPEGIIIQARKEGFLREILAAGRAITIQIAGEPNDFSVEVGIGKWLQNLAVTAVSAAITGGLFLIINVPAMLWNFNIESEIIDKITRIIESKPEIPAE